MDRQATDESDQARRMLLVAAATIPFLAVAGRAGALHPVSPQPAEPPADLAAAVRAYDRATTSNDIAALAALVADDYLLVNSDSSVQYKPDYLADFELPGFRLEPYVLEEPVLRVWSDTALTGGLMELRWTQDGERHRRRLRIAHVWTRQAGHWQIRYTQLTRVPES